MRFVQSLVNEWSMKPPVDPVDAIICEEQEAEGTVRQAWWDVKLLTVVLMQRGICSRTYQRRHIA